MKKKIAIPLSVALFAGVLGWWQFGTTEGLGEMEIRATKGASGQVEVVRDGTTIPVDEVVSLRPMDLIRTKSGAEAQLRLAGDRDILLAASTQAVVLNDRSIETQKGNLLATTTDPLQVRFGGVDAFAEQAMFRVDRGFSSSRVGAYAGEFRLAAPGQEDLTVGSLLEANIAADDLPRDARPYDLDPGNGWDQLYLEDAITLEGYLGNVARGLRSQLGASRPNLQYFGALAGGRVPFMRPHMRRPTTDLLIGFTVADNVKGTPLRTAVRETFKWRDEGGSWGIVAGLVNARPKLIITALGDLIGGTGAAASGGGGEPQFTIAAAAASAGDTSTPSDGGTGSDNPGDPGDKDPGDPGDGGDPPPPECTDTVECASQQVQDRLPGQDPDPDPSPSGGSGQSGDGPLDLLP